MSKMPSTTTIDVPRAPFIIGKLFLYPCHSSVVYCVFVLVVSLSYLVFGEWRVGQVEEEVVIEQAAVV